MTTPMRKATMKMLHALAGSRHNQRKSPLFVVEGLRCCREAVDKRPQWLCGALFSDQPADPAETARLAQRVAECGVQAEYCGAGEFAQCALTEAPQGVMLFMRKPEAAAPRQLDPLCTLILDRVQEPGNLGTILRTAWAFGVRQVWTTAGCAEVWSPKVIRAGMGAQFAVGVHGFATLSDALAAFRALGGRRAWCAVMDAPTSCLSPDFHPCGNAIVLGNEGNGIASPELGEGVAIPMPGHAESLNVAQAATILMYEALRRSRAPRN